MSSTPASSSSRSTRPTPRCTNPRIRSRLIRCKRHPVYKQQRRQHSWFSKSRRWPTHIDKDIEFHPTTPDGDLQETTAGFRTSPEILSSSKTADVSKILAAILAAIDNFNRRGFGWQITRVVHFSITFALYATGTRKYIYSNSKKNSIKKQWLTCKIFEIISAFFTLFLPPCVPLILSKVPKKHVIIYTTLFYHYDMVAYN